MNFSNFSDLFQLCSMNFPNLCIKNLTENKGTFQNYFKQLHSNLETISPLLIFIATGIDVIIGCFIWINIHDEFEKNQKMKKEFFASSLKVRTSLITTFVIPLLAQLKVEAIFAFLVSIAKIILEFYETFQIDKKYPESSIEEEYELLQQEENFPIIMTESESLMDSFT